MRTDDNREQIEKQVFSHSDFGVGCFRLAPDFPGFQDTGPIHGHLLVFPRSSVAITHEGKPAIHADANVIMFYNRGQRYTRSAISPEGDRCDYFRYSSEVVVDAMRVIEPEVQDRPDRPFAWTHADCKSNVYLAQRTLVRLLQARDPLLDNLAIKELLLRILELGLSCSLKTPDAKVDDLRPATQDRNRQQILAALALLARRFANDDQLETIADLLDLSPFHLCRLFRKHTGSSIHAYRNQLRLRAALEQLEDGRPDLTRIALNTGFSSHSHFTASFRRAFGVSPSVVSRQRAGELVKIAGF